jgi:HB1/ASXL restriction endonuclease-like protein with HTH domain
MKQTMRTSGEDTMDNGTTTIRTQVSAVLDLTNQALAEVERDLKYLTQRQTQLREFLRLGDALLDGEAWGYAPPALVPVRESQPCDVPESGATPSAHPTRTPVRQTAAWHAEDILKEVGRPMRIAEMCRRLEARGTLKGKQPKESLKTALRHHSKVFQRVERGVYGLVAWGQPPMAVG